MLSNPPSNPAIEYVDVLDENGNTVGQIKQRSRVHWDGDWHRVVHVWIENGRGGLLIQKRGAQKQTYPDKWDVSCAGHVLSGHSSRDSAIREAQEELGLILSPLELRSVGTVRASHSDGFRHDNEIVDIYVVQRDVSPKQCVLQADEVAEVRLVEVSELEKQVARKDPELVPHRDEYAKLFAFLRQRNAFR